jgi:hypothetical protein
MFRSGLPGQRNSRTDVVFYRDLNVVMHSQVRVWALCSLWATLFFIRSAGGQDPPGPTDDPLSVPKASSEIQVDGILDEAVWDEALKIELNYEVSPRENVSPPVKTEALLTYSRSHLYIGFRAYDPYPGQIRAYLSDRDGIYNDDWVAVEMDTYNDQRRTFTLITNPLGVQVDGLGDARGVKDYSWDMIYDSAGKITDWGYSVELGIPFSSLRFQRSDGTQVWGLNAVRGYPRTVSHQIWNAPFDRSNSCRVCQFVKIEGFEGVSPGRNLEINPTVTAVQTMTRDDFPHGDFSGANREVDAGVTARWGVTPNMVLGGTVNPDFSHIDADAAQLDINQPFALFYPEKRPFFNEGSDIFKTPLDLVYTRTMRDPNWGVKLTGKESGNTLGAYLVDDAVTSLIFPSSQFSQSAVLPASNTASVFRYERDFWNNSNVGVMVTNRDGADYFNRVYGVDGLVRLTRSDQVTFQFVGSSSKYSDEIAEEYQQPEGQFDDRALFFEMAHFTRRFRGDFTFVDIGEGFRADSGFLPRAGYQSFGTKPSYTWINEQETWWTSFELKGSFDYKRERDGALLNRHLGAALAYRGVLNSALSSGFRTARQSFGGQEFDLLTADVGGSFWPVGNLLLSFYARGGDAIDFANIRQGKSVRLSPSLFVKLGQHFRVSYSHVFERLKVEEKRLYTANISETVLSYHFTARTSLRALLQYVDYDYNVSNYLVPVAPAYRNFLSQIRFSYKINPRTVLYVGYTDEHLGSHEYDLTRRNYTLFAKIGYAWVM